MQLPRIPIAVELFHQWRDARGGRETSARRPFSRGWEDLLEAAGIVTASARRDAEQDARELAAAGWVGLRAVRYRPQSLDRILLPLEQEGRWCAAFGHVAPDDDTTRRQRALDWVAELSFLANARASLPLGDLQALNGWLARNPTPDAGVPIKERSLEILGDEKRLDGLLPSSVFEPGRLTLERLGCFLVAEPLAWKRGPVQAAAHPVLVLENAATWHSYDRWNQVHGHFAAVVYGGGNRFRDSVTFLSEVFQELGGSRRVLYFGDLDPAGLRIPRVAAERARAAGLPPVEPHLWSYRELWRFLPTEPGDANAVADATEAGEEPDLQPADLAWLGDLSGTVAPLLRSGRRLAQEHVGWTHLSTRPDSTREVHG